MQFLKLTVLIGMTATLTACGSADESQGQAARPVAKASSAADNPTSRVAATAAEIAEDARGKLRCPARPKSAPRADSAPVDDIVGVRPGMSYDDAVSVVLCSHELLVIDKSSRGGFKINTYGETLRQGFGAVFAEDRINKTSKEIMAEMQNNAMARSMNKRGPGMPGGTARWYVTTMGLPNEERVMAVARIEAYEEGKAPSVMAVATALAEKYGTPTRNREDRNGTYLDWTYDLRDRPVTETSPLIYSCSAPSNPDSGVNLSPDCGIAISAIIRPMRDNPLIAATLEIGAVNQAQGYELLKATERQLESNEQQRRMAELDAASRNADKPTL